jgi:hypothetical protein
MAAPRGIPSPAAQGGIRAALKEAFGRPRLILGLALLNLVLATVAAQPLSSALSPIDLRPAATAMMGGDDGLLLELLGDRNEILRVGMGALIGPVLLGGLFAWLLAGGILDERRGLAGFLTACVEHARHMIGIGILGLLLRLIPILVTAGAAYALYRWWHTRGLRELVTGSAIVAVVGALSWAWVTAALDGARGQLVRGELPRARSGLKRAAWLMFARFSPLLSIAAVSVGGFVLVTLAYVVCARLWPSGLTLLPLKLCAAYGRAGVSVAALLAASNRFVTLGR